MERKVKGNTVMQQFLWMVVTSFLYYPKFQMEKCAHVWKVWKQTKKQIFRYYWSQIFHSFSFRDFAESSSLTPSNQLNQLNWSNFGCWGQLEVTQEGAWVASLLCTLFKINIKNINIIYILFNGSLCQPPLKTLFPNVLLPNCRLSISYSRTWLKW